MSGGSDQSYRPRRTADPPLQRLPLRLTYPRVFDQGEPGSSREEITGDSFSIELIGGAYNGYTRGGYIEGGNVQVES